MFTRLIVPFLLILAGGAAASSGPSSHPATIPSVVRTPRWPLKDRRTLFTDEEIRTARQNIAKFPSARETANAYIKIADEWAAWDDAKLADLIPSAVVPRAFAVSASSKCPKCGTSLADPNGKPAWIVDAHKPFKVACPVCNSVFPSNDYETYFRSGFTKKIGWDSQYVDDGWGWTDPKTGEKQWWVAFANHWTVHGKLRDAAQALGRAYLLTGEKRYAHKALVLLHRFAEVYPEMDHEPQSRYGTMMRAMGQHYSGKIVNHIWETDMITYLCEAYDACWDAIDGDEELHEETGKTGEQIRAFIEANLLEDAVDAYFDGKIRGNFGMHQRTLVHLALVRQHGDNERWLDSLMNASSSDFSLLGLNYALYNLIFRDGLPMETSWHYNSIWLEMLTQYAPLLQKTGRDPFAIPKVRRLYDGALAFICARGHNPSLGDGGTVYGGLIRPDLPTFQIAYRQYHDPRIGQYLAYFGAIGDGGLKTFDSLLHRPLEAPKQATSGPTTLPAEPTRLLDGYGMGILNNREDSVACALYYGLNGGHGHHDRLNIETYANGQPITPDLGYPDGANEFIPGIFTWSKTTVAHNSVTVDAKRQNENVPGTVELFADGKFARVMDVSAAGTYPQCDQYRRAVIMVDCGPSESYFVDIFTVRGGRQHDYSLHGPPGNFEVIGGQWSAQPRGTLAGEDIEIGQIYDDPKLGAPGYKGGYSSYAGSGFQHLYNVRRNEGGEWIGQWSHERDPSAQLRIRVLDQPGQQVMLANAHVSQIKFPQVLTYVIARTKGDDKLASRFVSLIEPFKGEPLIKHVRQLDVAGQGTAIEIERSDGGTDVIGYETADARVEVVRRDASGAVLARFALERRQQRGQVVGTDAPASKMRVKADDPSAEPEQFVGRVVHFSNDARRTAHTIVAAAREGDEIVLTTADDLLVGRARVDAAEPRRITTKTAMPLAPIYRGVVLADAKYQPLARVSDVSRGGISLAAALEQDRLPHPGDDVWLINVGPGDRFELPALIDEQRQ